MTLDVFRQKFEGLEKKGFVRSIRRGPAGIGHTLEHHLGLIGDSIISSSSDNVFQDKFFQWGWARDVTVLPDSQKIKLIAHRDKRIAGREWGADIITLFTFNQKVWHMPPHESFLKFGSINQRNGQPFIWPNVSLTPNDNGIFLNVTDDKILVQHVSGQIIASWSLQVLAERFMQEIPALILVSAIAEENVGREYFHFCQARIMRGVSPSGLGYEFKNQNFTLHLRWRSQNPSGRYNDTALLAIDQNLLSPFGLITVL